MKLDDALQNAWTANPPKGSIGKESTWLEFCSLQMSGNRHLIIDAEFAPSEADGLLVTLSPGHYCIQAKVIDYGTDKRVSRLRVGRDGHHSTVGQQIGTTWTDTAKTGVCDFETFWQACGGSVERAYEVIGDTLEQASSHGVAILDSSIGVVMPFVSSGFGDGEFAVFELVATDGERVGIEIEFISPGEPYPF